MNPFRRHMLLGIGMAALFPALAGRAAGQEFARPLPGGSFDPPSGAMRYRRTLIRELIGGTQVSVTRDFAIEFHLNGPGYEVNGHQIAAAVSAPDNLAGMADLERNRVERGVFPLTLDRAGRIVMGPEPYRRDTQLSLREALNRALSQISTSSLAAEDALTMRQFAAGVGRAANDLVSLLPAQLFAPGPDEIREEQQLILPNGDKGTLRTRFSGVADAHCGLLQEARREITTQLSGDSRRTTEKWSLSPL